MNSISKTSEEPDSDELEKINAFYEILYIELDDHDTIYLETANGCIGFYDQWTTDWNFRIYQWNCNEQGQRLNDKVIKEWLDFTEDNYNEAKRMFKEMTGLSLPTFSELCKDAKPLCTII